MPWAARAWAEVAAIRSQSQRSYLMRAIGLMSFGGPEVLRPVDIPLPEPRPGEGRIRVHAAAVNPTDAIFRAGNGQARLREDRPPPFVPGMDADPAGGILPFTRPLQTRWPVTPGVSNRFATLPNKVG